MLAVSATALAANSTYINPILPGFHPDPSCIFVPSWDNTYFCASSSFNAFPGIPIHASRDLQNWKLIGNAISRPEMLPALATTNRSTSGLWGPTLRYREEKGQGRFWISTTLVFDDLPKDNVSRWDNFVIATDDPYKSTSWTDPVHFEFGGYDTSLFWYDYDDDDDDGQVYVVGSHEYTVWPGIQLATIDLQNGKTGPWSNPWNGTGALAPEGPHIYKKDGFYYLMLAEGGTGLGHMVTMARSQHGIQGPYVPAPHNPLLTNANTTSFFQTVGHADLFQDARGSWWAVALSTRSGPEFLNYPMGRETVLTSVTWDRGEWPVFTNVSGTENGWELPPRALVPHGEGPYVDSPDHLTFPPGTSIPEHLVHWRLPTPDTYLVSPPGYDNSLVLRSSILNLTAYDGYYTGGLGQTFIGRRQTDNLFTYTLDVNASSLREEEDEVGVSVFLVQRYHFELGIVLLSSTKEKNSTNPTPHFRFRGISNTSIPDTIVPFPSYMSLDTAITMEIKAFNWTHYSFSAGPRDQRHLMQTYGYARGSQMSWGFTGTLVGPYATTNGRNGSVNGEFSVAVSNWTYIPQGQIIN
ncbi:CAZyme family GH43 [Paecilomyces variotii]|nr:CAZyme family GH43 [Paecilomyces variotii]